METVLNDSKQCRTLKESRPKAYAGLETLYRAASDVISDPQYERVAPAPESETLNTWGIEMFYYGITRGYKLARQDMREEGILNPSCAEGGGRQIPKRLGI